jgi:hypothetical protein
MKAAIEITNELLFNRLIDEVNVEGLSCGEDYKGRFYGYGDIGITYTDGSDRIASGEFGSRDYEEEYGFRFVCEYEPEDIDPDEPDMWDMADEAYDIGRENE